MRNDSEPKSVQITVYTMTDQEAAGVSQDLMRQKMPLRMEKTDRCRYENVRLMRVAAGYLMLTALGVKGEEELTYGEQGKPFAPGYPPFNLSHSGGLAVLAVYEKPEANGFSGTDPGGARLEIGVDVEQIRERNLSAAGYAFTQRERDWMREADRAEEARERFFRIWTLKEAVMKADGRGLGLGPASFDVMDLMQGKKLELDGRTWYASTCRMDGYIISVCTERYKNEICVKAGQTGRRDIRLFK